MKTKIARILTYVGFIAVMIELPFTIYHSPRDEVKVTYGLNSTPSTIVVSPAGKILQYWRGAYSEDVQAEVEQFFQVKLPGLIKE